MNERTNHPLRYGNLFAGSLFTIVAEPSRRIFKSKDKNVYRKAYNGFYSVNVATGEGCILFPNDIVQRVRNDSGKKGSK